MVFDAQEGGGGVEDCPLGRDVGGFDCVGAFVGEVEGGVVELDGPLWLIS